MSIAAAVRRVARNAFELVSTTSGLTGLSRRLNRDAVAILAYHNVVPDGEAGRGDASLHLPLSAFLRQIESVARNHEVVDLDAAAGPGDPSARARGRPRAVITFDDAYRGAVTLALPELARRGLAATVFVSPGLLGTASTWWDELAEADLLSPGARDTALTRLAGRTESIRSRHFASAPPKLPDSYRIATREELEEHVRVSITLGSHAWAHEHLPSLEPAELLHNLRATLDWLEQFPGRTNRWLALPYGSGAVRTRRAAMQIGHTGVLQIRGGLWKASDDGREAVPRINVPAGVSVRGLELRTSGLLR